MSNSCSEMEKNSVAATNEKVSNHIPDDLAFSMLSKLPLKSLKRFGCVKKSWTLLFENPYFISMYRNNFKDDASILLKQVVPRVPGVEGHSLLYLLSGERFENKVKLDWLPPFHDDDRYIHIFGSSNGTLCLLHWSEKVVLWNPTTEKFKVIPPSPVESGPPYREPSCCLNGFGYDHVRNDYKVIRRVVFFEIAEYDFDRYGIEYDGPLDLENVSFDPLSEIYSLRSNSWRKLDVEIPTCWQGSVHSQVYTDGLCHSWGANETAMGVACLVSFDLSNEVFYTTPMPSDMGGASFEFRFAHLVVLNGSVAFIYNYAETTTFQISILGELGVKESWTKLFIVGPLPCIDHPIGVGTKSDIFFKKKDDDLAWFDLSTQMIVELGVKGRDRCCQIVIYEESLESLIPIGLDK